MQQRWQDRARCKGQPWEMFFNADETTGTRHRLQRPSKEAQATCDACPVAGECLSWALRKKEHGIWGGTTDGQREQILKIRYRVHCPRCDSREIVRSVAHAVCMSCGISWRAPSTRPAPVVPPHATPPATSSNSPQWSAPSPTGDQPHLAPLAA